MPQDQHKPDSQEISQAAAVTVGLQSIGGTATTTAAEATTASAAGGALAPAALVVVAATVLVHEVTATLDQNAKGREQLAAIESIVAVANAHILAMASENTKGARPSTEQKHEDGKARKRRDRGGEKGDRRRPPPRKRPDGWKGKWPPPPGTHWW